MSMPQPPKNLTQNERYESYDTKNRRGIKYHNIYSSFHSLKYLDMFYINSKFSFFYL